MNKLRFPRLIGRLDWGAIQIAALYLLLGGLWILFSDQAAARIAVNEKMFTAISLYKGWGYVLVTALLLYWLVQRYTRRLKESEESYELLAENITDVIWVLDLEANRFRYISPSVKRLRGFSPQEVLAQDVAAFITTDPTQYFEKILPERILEFQEDNPRTYADEVEQLRNDGTTVWTEMTTRFVVNKNNGHLEMYGVSRDISERKRAEEEVRLWADAFEGCAHGIAIGDVHTNRIVVCNPAFASLHKRRVEDVIGSAILSLYAPADHEHVRHNVQKADQIGHCRFEAQMIRRDGSTFPVQMDLVSVPGDNGELLYRVATAQDISERKQAEKELQESEERYRRVSELTSDYAYKDRVEADGSIVPEWITDSFVRITGYTLREAQTPGFWQELIYPEDILVLRRHMQKFLSGQKSSEEMRVKTKRGELRWLRDIANPVWDANQRRVVSLFGAVQDVTEYKRAEEQVLHQAHLLAQVNDAVIATDENFVINSWNPAAERIYGWQADEVIGKPAGEVLKTKFHNQARSKTIEEVNETGEFSAEVTQLRKDGSRLSIEAHTVSVRGADGSITGYVSVNRDITTRKQMEEERISLARFPAEDPNPVLRATYEGKILYANPASEPLLRDWDTEVGDCLPADWMSFVKELINTGARKTIDVQCAGTTYSVMIVPIPHAREVNLYGKDMTEHKQAEQALRRSEALLRQTSEVAKVGGWELDLQTMKLLWSPETYRIHAVDLSFQPDVEKAIDFYTPESRPVIRDAVQRAIEEGQPFDLELSIVDAQGTLLWVRAIGQVEIQDGRKLRLLGTFQDITERKQAEENLRRFELLSEHSRDIILFMGNKDGRILEANAAALQAYGYSRAELLSLTVRDLRAGDTSDLANQMAQAEAGGILFETVHRRRDGSTFPVEVSSQGATIGGTRMLISIVRDITERKQAEQALQLKDELLHLTSEMAKVGGWEFDAETGNGTWTDEVARIHGLEPNQETNVEIGLSFYTGESREKVEQAVKEAVELARPYDLELEMITAKSAHKWVRTMGLPIIQDGKVIKVQGIFQDITERKQIEQALQAAHAELELKVQERTAALSEANALLQALMDHMPEQIYFKDTQSRFIRNSRSQANLLGLNDPSETVGKTDFDFFPHAAQAYAEEQEVMRSGKPLVDFEEWVVWPDGREMWVSTTKVPLRNAEGQTMGIFGISHDITGRKRAEQAIRQLNTSLERKAEELVAANKELEAFSYSVSHDLRAPLRAIDGYTRILVEDYEEKFDAEGRRICGVISAEARRMGQLIDDLLAFSRLGRKEMFTSKIDMKALAISVFEELAREPERERIDFQIGKLPGAKGDLSLMHQVWVNLLSNALKFTSKKELATIEVGSKQTREENIYFVRDSGAGFDMEYANKLFGVFQRLHGESEFEGTGVGLAIVQRIIRRHGGRVWAEGEEGNLS
jgi:PAS domain S-box-containing protein